MADTFVKIATVTVGAGGASSIDFSSIPSTYTDLQVVFSTRVSGSGNYLQCNVGVNGQGSGTNITARTLWGVGTTVGSNTSEYGFHSTGSSATASTFANASIYFPNYAGSTNKSYSVDDVTENNATDAVRHFTAGLWSQTAAINQLTFTPSSGSFVQYSTATLYGISKS